MDPDSNPDPAYFVIDLQGAKQKKIFFNSISAYYFLRVHLHHLKKKKVKKKSQNTRNPGFSYLIRTSDLWIQIRILEAQNHTDPTDPDPQHCLHDNEI